MSLFKFAADLSVALASAYVFAWPLRDILHLGHGPLIQITRKGQEIPWHRLALGASVRVGVYYCLVVTTVTLGTAGIVSLLDGDSKITVGAILVALFSTAISRFLSMSYSNFVIRSLYSLTLTVLAAAVYLARIDPTYMHNIVEASLVANQNIVHMYGIGVFVTAVVSETCLYLGPRILGRARQVSYNLVREYHEGGEPYQMAAYRGPIATLFVNSIRQSLIHGGLQEFYWKTWDGDLAIAKELRRAIGIQLSTTKPYNELSNDELERIHGRVKQHIQDLHKKNKAFVIMSHAPPDPSALVDEVENILGIKPITIPDVGLRRYLVINRRHAIISLPIPAAYSQSENGSVSATGSNFAVATRDPTRVHECLIEFEGLLNTYYFDQETRPERRV